MSFQLFPYYCLVVLILDRCGRKTKEGKTGSCAFINRSFTSLTSLLWDGLEDGVISCDGPGLRLCSDVKRKAGKENISYDLYTMQLRPEGSKNRRETKGKCPSPHSTKDAKKKKKKKSHVGTDFTWKEPQDQHSSVCDKYRVKNTQKVPRELSIICWNVNKPSTRQDAKVASRQRSKDGTAGLWRGSQSWHQGVWPPPTTKTRH